MDFKKILFPTDFSEGSVPAISVLADLAKKYDAKIYIVNVIYDIASATGWYVPHSSMDDMYRDLETSAKKEIERVGVEELRGYPNVVRMVVKGIPDDEIIRIAKDEKIDLIVMGTHGRKGIDRILFGSTASEVVRNAPCPVLTVRVPGHK